MCVRVLNTPLLMTVARYRERERERERESSLIKTKTLFDELTTKTHLTCFHNNIDVTTI